ncbi:hypothetical protein WJX72_001965 [[Myrmecia] bisecta]|uniref:Uncharacterized protein n=1 Tax=[Myrmecia] bisecta TaxID=41462 RepID=A0AAW1R527_9CHLO
MRGEAGLEGQLEKACPSPASACSSSRLRSHSRLGREYRGAGPSLDVKQCEGYALHPLKLPFALVVLSCTAGLLLLFRTNARLVAWLCLRRCRLEHASCVIVTLTSGRQAIAWVQSFQGTGAPAANVRLIEAFFTRLVFDPERSTYRPLPHVPSDLTHQLLEGGTDVLQVWAAHPSQTPLAMVCRTRFCTAKGQLLSSLATSIPPGDKYLVRDLAAYMLISLTLGTIAFAPVIQSFFTFEADRYTIAITVVNMITTSCPCELPTCFAIMTAVIVWRLWQRSIAVSDTSRIILAGHVNLVCLDKTGTVTETAMHVKGLLPVVERDLQPLIVLDQAQQWPVGVRELLATCHSLIEHEGCTMGDDMDKQPFAALRASFLGPDVVKLPSVDELCNSPTTYATLMVKRHFEFSSQLQRSVVVVKAAHGSGHMVHAKGSPEAILRMVDIASVPNNYEGVLDEYTSQGFRVLALATGHLCRDDAWVRSQAQTRIEEEANLRFVGMLVIANKLQTQAKGTLKLLHNRAQMRTVMVTGDHVVTAISVAMSSGMMYANRPVCVIDAVASGDSSYETRLTFTAIYKQPRRVVALTRGNATHLIQQGKLQCAITGAGFAELLCSADDQVMQTVMHNVTVAARMLPHHKQDIVCLLGNGVEAGLYGHHPIKGLGHCVAMVGDGLNDMSALHSAHVGLALSTDRASVAAPFTARNCNMGSIAGVLAEGRCSLVLFYFLCQYMMVYCQIVNITTNICTLYNLSMSNNQYALLDIFFAFTLMVFMAFTRAEPQVARAPPPARLLSLPNILPSAVQTLVATATSLGAIELLQLQPWFVHVDTFANPDMVMACESPEVATQFLVNLVILVNAVIVLTRGLRSHMCSIWTNKPLVACIGACYAFVVYLIFEPASNKVTQYACMIELPLSYRIQLFIYCLISLPLAFAADLVLQRVPTTQQERRPSFAAGYTPGETELRFIADQQTEQSLVEIQLLEQALLVDDRKTSGR